MNNNLPGIINAFKNTFFGLQFEKEKLFDKLYLRPHMIVNFDLWHPSCNDTMGIKRNRCLLDLATALSRRPARVRGTSYRHTSVGSSRMRKKIPVSDCMMRRFAADNLLTLSCIIRRAGLTA